MQQGVTKSPDRDIQIWLIEDSKEYTHMLSYLIKNISGLAFQKTFLSVELCFEEIKMPFAVLPDLVLLDHQIRGGVDGIDGLKTLKELLPNTPIVILTSHDDAQLIFKAISNGASGYLLKDVLLDELVLAVRQSLRVGFYMPPGVAHLMLSLFQSKEKEANSYGLTPREKEVLLKLSTGLQQREIADELNIAPKTVDNHLQSIYQKMHVNSGIAAVAKAFGEGLL
ncbi:MAG: response regulator transcription factor [Bacteroidota bacterium]